MGTCEHGTSSMGEGGVTNIACCIMLQKVGRAL